MYTHPHTHTPLPPLPLITGRGGQKCRQEPGSKAHPSTPNTTAQLRQQGSLEAQLSHPHSGSPAASGCPRDPILVPGATRGLNFSSLCSPFQPYCSSQHLLLTDPRTQHPPASRDFPLMTSPIAPSSTSEEHGHIGRTPPDIDMGTERFFHCS